MSQSSFNALTGPVDGRQSETARMVARGTSRFLASLGLSEGDVAAGLSCVEELPLPSGGRADLVAMNALGEIWIVEIKSSREDLRTDRKWESYRAHCDRLFFCLSGRVAMRPFPTGNRIDCYGQLWRLSTLRCPRTSSACANS